MKTWNDYKTHVKTVDPDAGKDLDSIEEQAAIISTIINRRTQLGITQRELALICGIPQSPVARIEAHTVTPKLDTLLRIMRPLGLKLTVTSK